MNILKKYLKIFMSDYDSLPSNNKKYHNLLI